MKIFIWNHLIFIKDCTGTRACNGCLAARFSMVLCQAYIDIAKSGEGRGEREQERGGGREREKDSSGPLRTREGWMEGFVLWFE